jgi:hypothetical protein
MQVHGRGWWAALVVGVLATVVGCSNSPMEPVRTQELEAGAAALTKLGQVATYRDRDQRFEFQFMTPGQQWRRTSHGAENINGNKTSSDVYVYSPSEKYVPRMSVIVFSREKDYPAGVAEKQAQAREGLVKKHYPERYLGHVETRFEEIGGQQAPVVVYDMLDETQSTMYRSTEYTFVLRGKLCTIQFTRDMSEPDNGQMAQVLDAMRASFAVRTF